MNDALVLRMAHVSMQFSDRPKHQAHDVRVVFDRGYHVITGTESGPDNALFGLVAKGAAGQGYRVAQFRAQWVAFHEDIIHSGWRKGYVPSIEAGEGYGRHPDRGIAWGACNTSGYGRLTVGAGHLLTHGDRPGDPNYRLNTRYTGDIAKWGRRKGSKQGLCFYGGDQNDDDRKGDTFRGGPFTTCWDELGKHPNTHGGRTLDVLASYDHDRRVKCLRARSFSDGAVFLNTDHWLIEADYKIEPKRTT